MVIAMNDGYYTLPRDMKTQINKIKYTSGSMFNNTFNIIIRKKVTTLVLSFRFVYLVQRKKERLRHSLTNVYVLRGPYVEGNCYCFMLVLLSCAVL